MPFRSTHSLVSVHCSVSALSKDTEQPEGLRAKMITVLITAVVSRATWLRVVAAHRTFRTTGLRSLDACQDTIWRAQGGSNELSRASHGV